ncbi:hypothetical protein HYH02_003268 [Chlamydomonas schloesseri]|uniref:[phosphatase 2A protein]-leucine-carboxy methyltransferase n=1 Tax=Chlamydomonas schloesseri TaxID=2026947 RepID=A0A836B9Z7_9CHLO|nr:hypothetical protein HYH02_003268 [Chlamydomonas schloesseri]|eukprot:KAG2452241.1 hypothetical protein HYH02_003268 [Chlamydomonas schloesseri]
MLRSVEGSDVQVQGTNDDAQVSKLSCSRMGYFRDEFIQFFVRRASRRSPLINRGYYSRHAALRQLLEQFIAAARAAGKQPQVLVLGAGFDTTWFQLAKDGGGAAPYNCLEVDFKEVTQRKAAIIAKEPALHGLLQQASSAVAAARGAGEAAAAAADGSSTAASSSNGAGAGAAVAQVEIDAAAGSVRSPCYSLAPVDLRDLGALEAAAAAAGFDTQAPTYILSECVLVYMDPAQSSPVVGWAGATFPNALMAIYEQIKPDDAFGRQMVSNLAERGCPLKGLPATPSLQAHCGRLTAGGWAAADARSMDTLYQTFLPPEERQRAERLEIFDELEEWHMIQEHYCIALGRNDRDGLLPPTAVGFDAPPPAHRLSLPALPPQMGPGAAAGAGGAGGAGLSLGLGLGLGRGAAGGAGPGPGPGLGSGLMRPPGAPGGAGRGLPNAD